METTIKQTREERAEEILTSERPVVKTSEGYRVPSQRDPEQYYLVTKRNGHITCDCNDFTRRRSEGSAANSNGSGNGKAHKYPYCKHIICVSKALKKGQVAIEKSPTSAILEHPFRADQVLDKNGLSYVEGAAIVQRLLDSGIDWSYEILDVHELASDEVLVRGRLTLFVNGREIRKEGFGGASFIRSKGNNEIINRANTYKSASKNALKGCAALAGVALHLYSEGNRYQSFASV